MAITQQQAHRYESGTFTPSDEQLTVEHPLQVKINDQPYSVTMRTPGEDRQLVTGLMLTEGIVVLDEGKGSITLEREPESELVTAVNVTVPDIYLCDNLFDKRSLVAMSSCGLCGQREFALSEVGSEPLAHEQPLAAGDIPAMMNRMREAQNTFTNTGSAHAAGLFSEDGQPLCVYEDIGRHNAVDKVIGEAIITQQLSKAIVLTVSGRISFEIVAKAYRAGVPYILAVSAPSSLAVEMGDAWGMSIVGYCRDNRATVYSHPEWVKP